MILLRKFVFCVGAALIAASILIASVSTVWAQQGSIQGTRESQVLFQMQAMRQEIAELRDMVERQAYQLRQLQNANVSNQDPRQLTQQSEQIAAQAVPNSVSEAPTGVQVPAGVQAPSVVQVPSAAQVPTAAQVPVPAVSSSVPTGANSSEGIRANERPVYVEERVINPSNAPYQAGQSKFPDIPNNYPPVEERTINSSQAGQQVPVYNPEIDNQSSYNSNSSIEPQGSYSSQASNPNFPTPYQRQSPARQPAQANIPSAGANTAAAAGGIISIPQQQPGSPQVITEPNSVSTARAVSIDEQTYYQQGFELLKQSKHDEAVTTFKKQINDYPSGTYADDAHYWIAESLYVNRDLDQSKLYFKSIMERFDESPRLPDAMLKTAYIEQEQGNAIEARILLQEIIQFHPRSNAAISAKNRLADLN